LGFLIFKKYHKMNNQADNTAAPEKGTAMSPSPRGRAGVGLLGLYKPLAVVLMLYVLLAGMLAPLTPGIYSTTPNDAKIGEPFRLEITGYNTEFLKETPRFWLKTDEKTYIKATEVGVKDDNTLNALFNLNKDLPTTDAIVTATLVMDSKLSGTVVLPAAVSITQRANPLLAAEPNEHAKPSDFSGDIKGLQYPFRSILEETIRNLYYHVPLWFAMLIILATSMVYSIQHLNSGKLQDDIAAVAFAKVGVLFGILGTITGALWAQYTWGKAWSWDIKQIGTAVSLLIYFAYFVLRSSFEDDGKRARIAAVYNIFAFASLIPLLFIIPRITSSLHPGNGGNPAFSQMDLNSNMRMVFYPAVIAFTLMGVWISNLLRRLEMVIAKRLDFL
jgi:heme exporter protein C